ncbi:hypothetical protein [Winogradskyella haliclonae]|nr:hypothetical protein [Winogradskyella haliclonae]
MIGTQSNNVGSVNIGFWELMGFWYCAYRVRVWFVPAIGTD